jgi:hypothetical protein
MKRFIAGFVSAFVICATAFALQMHMQGDNVAPTQVVLDNASLTIERNILEPGQSSPVLTHTLPHVTVVVRGSTIHILNGNGTAVDKDRPAGFVAYDVPSATPNPHTVINAGKTTFEMLTIQLKNR